MINMNSLLVINLRGMVKLRHDVKRTLRQLRIARRYSATVISDNDVNRGMLHVLQTQTAWCKADAETLSLLLTSRGRSSMSKQVTDETVRSLGYEGITGLARAISEGTIGLVGVTSIKPFFRLHPPRGGFLRSTRRMYTQGGILGENPSLPKILRTML